MWRGVREGGLGGGSERRACESCWSFCGKRDLDDSCVAGAWRGGDGRVGAEVDKRWIVLEGLTGGDGASIVQKAAPYRTVS